VKTECQMWVTVYEVNPQSPSRRTGRRYRNVDGRLCAVIGLGVEPDTASVRVNRARRQPCVPFGHRAPVRSKRVDADEILVNFS
jgi:hypothetical protein